MAEVTAFRHNALPYPVYGLPWAVVFPMLDADGDLVTGATTPDAEVSKNGDTFADCTNESTEIATNSGVYYLLLTGTEMTADIVTVIAKSATAGMKTTVLTLYPRKLVTFRASTVGANAADGSTIQLDSSAQSLDDHYTGCLIAAVIDGTTEVRIIGGYTGSTKVCTLVGPNFITAPDNNDTFTIYIPDGGREIQGADVHGWANTAVSAATAGIPDVNVKNIDNDAASASGTVTFPNATLASTTNITAATGVDITKILGTAISTPATAGILDVNVKNINNTAAATPGASGGILIAGSNAAVTYASETITGTLTISDGLVVTRSSSNTSAVSATGNGTGHGAIFTSGSGATGNGVQATSAATNGHGLRVNGNGSGAGVSGVGGATGSGGALTAGASGGSGLILAPQVATGQALTLNGIGSGDVMKLTPGSTGVGLRITGGSVSGDAVIFSHSGAGNYDLNASIHGTIDTTTDVTNPVTLTAAYDAAKTAATQTSVDDLPTNAELATALGTADDATLAAIAALNNLSAAQVNAEVVDALATDTYAEPGQGAPAATTTLAAKINYIFKMMRNKKDQTSTLFQLYADDASTVDQKAAVSDDGTTATVGELASGP